MIRWGIVAAGLLMLAAPADARHRHHVRHHHHVTHHRPALACQLTGAGGLWVIDGPCLKRIDRLREMNRRVIERSAGYTRVCVSGHCGTVAAALAEKFRGLFIDLLALGYNIGHPGCLSSGHMRHSLHHWGGACDLFNQIARNRTALRQPPPHVQIELAARHGLTSGCVWRSPDCGHFDVSGIEMRRVRRVARAR